MASKRYQKICVSSTVLKKSPAVKCDCCVRQAHARPNVTEPFASKDYLSLDDYETCSRDRPRCKKGIAQKDTNMKNQLVTVASVVTFGLLTLPAYAMSDADDACINQLRLVGGPDGASGTILSSEFSEAGTLVMLEDAGGTTWRCIAYQDGSIGELAVVDGADDGGGAMAGSGNTESTTNTVQVRFDAGTNGAELTASLTAGSSTRYVLGAKDGQFLYVRVAPKSGSLGYMIYNPDGSALLDFTAPDIEYRGQLWQSGDHIIQVFNDGTTDAQYNVIFGVD